MIQTRKRHITTPEGNGGNRGHENKIKHVHIIQSLLRGGTQNCQTARIEEIHLRHPSLITSLQVIIIYETSLSQRDKCLHDGYEPV